MKPFNQRLPVEITREMFQTVITNRSITVILTTTTSFFIKCRLYLSSLNLHKGSLQCTVVNLRTKLKFLYISGSQLLYLLHRNKPNLIS